MVEEGIVDDLRQGHIPNIFAEKAMKAEWKYDRAGLTKKILVAAVVAIAVVAILSPKKERPKRVR